MLKCQSRPIIKRAIAFMVAAAAALVVAAPTSAQHRHHINQTPIPPTYPDFDKLRKCACRCYHEVYVRQRDACNASGASHLSDPHYIPDCWHRASLHEAECREQNGCGHGSLVQPDC